MKARFVYYWDLEGVLMATYRTDDGSDVCADTLHDRAIPIPPTPTYTTWRNLVFSRRRCGFCWAEIDGTLAHLNAHVGESHAGRLKVG